MPTGNCSCRLAYSGEDCSVPPVVKNETELKIRQTGKPVILQGIATGCASKCPKLCGTECAMRVVNVSDSEKTPFIKTCMSACQSKCQQKCAAAELDTTGDEILSKQNTTEPIGVDNKTAVNVSAAEVEMTKSFGADTSKAKAVKSSESPVAKSSTAPKDKAADGESPSNVASASKIMESAAAVTKSSDSDTKADSKAAAGGDILPSVSKSLSDVSQVLPTSADSANKAQGKGRNADEAGPSTAGQTNAQSKPAEKQEQLKPPLAVPPAQDAVAPAPAPAAPAPAPAAAAPAPGPSSSVVNSVTTPVVPASSTSAGDAPMVKRVAANLLSKPASKPDLAKLDEDDERHL